LDIADDEDESEESSDSTEYEHPEVITVDLQGLNDRIHPVSDVTPGTWRRLEATWGGFFAIKTTGEILHNDGIDETPPPTLIQFDVASGPTVVTDDIANYVISADRMALAMKNEMSEWSFYHTMAEIMEPFPPIDHLLEIETTAEWAQILDEAWRLQRDFFWNPKMNGVDWDAMREKYAGRLDLIGSRDELDDLIGRMMSELECSHAYVWQEGEPVRSADYVPFAMLGAELAPHPDGYEIARILPGRSWDEDGRSPLASSWLGIEEGDVILEIDGRPVDPNSNPWSMLDGIPGDTIRLVVMPKDRAEEIFVVNAPVVYDESRLRYNAWVDGNREAVDAASEGRFGYLHLTDMDTEGLSQFGHQFPGQGDKDGLVIDIRSNGGGFVSQLILDQLNQKVTGYDQPRHGSTMTYPQHAFPGHMVVLMDQHSGSDGDIFPYMFREMELGPLLGMRTWGGVVGIRSDKGAVDGGMTTQPEYATWTLKDGWDIENYGVDPDIEVDNTPHDHVEGRDRQLERAIEELERRTREMPIETPEPPAYPE
jgi:tricorn protease